VGQLAAGIITLPADLAVEVRGLLTPGRSAEEYARGTLNVLGVALGGSAAQNVATAGKAGRVVAAALDPIGEGLLPLARKIAPRLAKTLQARMPVKGFDAAADAELRRAATGSSVPTTAGTVSEIPMARAGEQELAQTAGRRAQPKPITETVTETPAKVAENEAWEVEGVQVPRHADGTVTVYHHTTQSNADSIRKTGTLRSAGEPDVYVTTTRENIGYGDVAVPIRINPDLLRIDDVFPDGRVDFAIDTGRPRGFVKVLVDDPPETPVVAPVKAADEGVGVGAVQETLQPVKAPEAGALSDSPPLDPNVTAAKNAVSNAERKALGLDELPEADRKSWDKTLSEAKEGYDGAKAQDLAKRTAADPKALDDVQTNVLTLRKAELVNEHKALIEEASEKIGKGEDAAELQARMQEVEDHFDEVTEALKKSGTETGRALNARKLTIGIGDSKLEAQARVQAKIGRKLTQDERKQIGDLWDRVQSATKRVEELEAKIGELAEAKVQERLSREHARTMTKANAQTRRDAAKKELSSALAELGATANMGLPIAPSARIVKAVREIVASYLVEGKITLEEAWERVSQDVPGLTRAMFDDAMAFVERKPTTGARARAAQLQKLRNEAKRYSEVGKAQELERVNKQIAELERKIAENDLSKPERLPPIESPDLVKARAERDRLRIALDMKRLELAPTNVFKETRATVRGMRLLNPINRIFDVVSNTVSNTSRFAESAADVAFDRLLFHDLVKEQGPANLLPSVARLQRAARGWRTRWAEEIKTQLQVGDPAILGKLDAGHGGEAKTKGLKWVNAISRFAGTSDIPFKDTAYRYVIEELAELESKRTGRSVASLIENPTPSMVAIAENEALEATFMNSNAVSTMFQQLERMVRAEKGEASADAVGLIRDLLIPFPKVIGNVAGRATEYGAGVGIGLAKILMTRQNGKAIGIAERRAIARMFSRNLFGMGFLSLGYALHANGGLKPERVDKEGGYVKWNDDMEKIGGPMSLVLLGSSLGAIQKASLTDKQRAGLVWKTSLSLLADQPAVSGTKAATELLGGDRSPAKFTGGMVRSLIPSIIREWARRQDPREVATDKDSFGSEVADEIKKGVPFLRETLKKKK